MKDNGVRSPTLIKTCKMKIMTTIMVFLGFIDDDDDDDNDEN